MYLQTQVLRLLSLSKMQLNNLLSLNDNVIPTLPLDPLRQTLRVGIIKRLLAKDGSPLPLSLGRVIAAWQSPVCDGAVVPVCDAAGLPFPAHGEVVSGVEVFSQEIQGVDALLSFQLGNVDDEEGVVEEGF